MRANWKRLQHNKIIMKKTKLMVTNLVHLRTAITQSCVPEVFSRVRRSSRGAGAMVGPAPGEKRPERCSGRRIRLFFMSVITFCSSTASVTNFSKQCSRRSNGKVYSSVYFSFLRPTFCFIQRLLILGHMELPVISWIGVACDRRRISGRRFSPSGKGRFPFMGRRFHNVGG